MLELQHNAHCVAFQKGPEKGYHQNDPNLHLHTFNLHVVACENCFQVNHQGIGVQLSSLKIQMIRKTTIFFDSLFINSDLRSIYYITKKNYCICCIPIFY